MKLLVLGGKGMAGHVMVAYFRKIRNLKSITHQGISRIKIVFIWT